MIENQPPGQVEDTGSYDSTGYPVKFCWSCREMHRVDHSHHKTLPAQEGQEWEARKSDGHFYCVSTKAGKSFECRMWWVALDLAALLNAQGAEERRLREALEAIANPDYLSAAAMWQIARNTLNTTKEDRS